MRKGIGYIIEGIAALIIVLGFVLAISPSQDDVQTDWVDQRNEVMADDLSYVMKQSGSLDRFATRGDTGSIRSLGYRLSGGDFTLSGTIQRVPAQDLTVGWTIEEDDVEELQITEVDESDECSGQLEEIDQSHEDSPIMRTQDPINGAHLYLTDTDPDVAEGFDEFRSRPDYDTLWVDNGTRCQFAEEDGPFFKDDFFYGGDKEENGKFYEFKEVEDDENLILHTADQPAFALNEIEESLEHTDPDIEFETIKFGSDLPRYDVVVVRNSDTLETLEDEGFMDDYISFLEEQGSLVFMMDLEEEEVESHLEEFGLEWVDHEIESGEFDSIGFGTSSMAVKMESFFNLMDGDRQEVEIEVESQILPVIEGSIVTRDPEVMGKEGFEDGLDINENLDEGSSLDGLPESDCSDPLHYGGEVDFIGLEDPVTVATTPVDTDEDCRGTWLLSIDLEDDGSADADIGTLRQGDEIMIGGETYTVGFGEDGEYGEEVFFETEREFRPGLAINSPVYGGTGSNPAIFMPNPDELNGNDAKLLGSVLMGSRPDPPSFGSEEGYFHETDMAGRIEDGGGLFYELNLRWSD